MQVLYTAEAVATGDGRNGHTRTTDGLLEADLAVPKSMGGPGGATNPEQLFAAGYAACFHSALKLVARQAKVDATGSTVTARVGIGPTDGGGFGLTAALTVAMPAVERAIALDVVEKAHQVCPYSNATRGNIDVTLAVA
ncbi:organic hydroperoxide resistance protein [Phytohabitans rumicis]|uniref:Putative organic hydroperoxide resistance protein/OsmC-like protein n=1 Tax=Phytohabitans rumicis TaxID=1076125 RepID=A0A6V8LLK0_9ACTN|nr:organic hydroperoxide resistance protein [Phytohabitans rumicis]GFJ94957.1 putative organic hydroperoxide resistance protein/OsmC-like protein [Phytohabitans rumicis]